MTDTNGAGLYTKLAEIVTEVAGVEKDGHNDFHKYNYTSAEAMLRALRGPLASRNVVLMPSVVGIDEREIETSKGKASTVTTVRVSFTFVDGDTGHMHKCEWAGQGDDPADKGLSKAYTNAVKTFLREQFLIPQGDDPEADTRTDERASERRPATRQNGKPAAPPITPERHAALFERVRLALENGIAPERLSLIYTSIGGGAERFNDAALAQLTAEQANDFEAALASEVPA